MASNVSASGNPIESRGLRIDKAPAAGVWRCRAGHGVGETDGFSGNVRRKSKHFRERVSIRTRLLLLVFAVWLPALAGFGLLARSTYLHETEAAAQHIRDLARSISFVVDSELDKRAAVAWTLGAARSLKDGEMERFYEHARRATEGTGNTVLVVDATRQVLNTRRPFGSPMPARGWTTDPPLVSGPPIVTDMLTSRISGAPVITVLAPEPGVETQRFNIGVAFGPEVIQHVLDMQKIPEGAVAAVLDGKYRTVARNKDPQKWLGTLAAPATVAAASTGKLDQQFESTSREGEPTVAVVARSPRYGWIVAVGLPRTALDKPAIRVTLQAFGAAGALAAIGLLMALFFARQIGGPVLALSDAAAELGRDRVPAPLRTGLFEADQVGAALHEAGARSARATELLESRVAEAIRQTQEAQTRLLDGQKHEAIGRLTGGLAHDLNNFLQTMSTGLQVLDRQVKEDTGRRVIEASTRALDKAAALVRQMLAFGRTQTLKPQAVDLHDFVLRCEDLMGRAVGGKVRLTADIEPGLPPLLADPTQFELALLNLVFNARDAMPGGGAVVIRGRLASAIQSATLPPGRYLAVDVVDSGGGMDAEVLQRVFEPYFTTKAVGAGSGLGLPQVRAFAVQSGGAATIRSERGVGTTVSLVLPVSSDPVAAGAAAAVAPAEFTPLRVLFVEDDLLVSSVVVPALRACGHSVRHCLNGDAAVRALQDGGLFDVVFSDVVMPGTLSGLDLAAWCMANIPSMAVIVATGYTTQHIDSGVKVLSKPYSMDLLLVELQYAVRVKRA
jgi:signal transduction histidine kinase